MPVPNLLFPVHPYYSGRPSVTGCIECAHPQILPVDQMKSYHISEAASQRDVIHRLAI